MNVFIVNGNHEYTQMFKEHGWDITDDIEEAQLVQFTGGEDVTPSFYNELPHPYTSSSLDRDEEELIIFYRAKELKIPMAGICRGGQFLNVMNGGKLYQHVTKHGGYHLITDMETGDSVIATSTHHQMFRAGPDAQVLAVANQLGTKQYVDKQGNIVEVGKGQEDDLEALFYKDTQSLCFQPHPEFFGHPELSQYYFYLLNRWIKWN